MNFLNPAVLIGLIAAAIPLILHLINLRKLKNVEFSSLKFIKELQKTKIKKLKIKQWLLLIIRTLIIIFIVMAFARPIADTKLPYFASYSKSSTVILVDNSFSMDVSDEYGNRLKQSKRIASDIVSLMEDGDETAIIPMAETDYNSINLSRNYNVINERIDNINISNLKADYKNSILTALNILDDAVNLNKEIFIISDAAINNFDGINDSLGFKSKSTGINFIQTGRESAADIKNYSIDSLSINNQIFQYGSEISLNALISNHSDNEIEDLLISLLFNGKRVSQRTTGIPGNGESVVSVETEINQRGAVNAILEIENDELLQDNKKYFSFLIPEKPNVAILSNSNPRYLNLALSASGSEMSIENYPSNNFGSVRLNNYDLIIIADAPENDSDLSRLKRYTEGGGSILAFASSEMNENYVALLNEFGFGNINQKRYSEENPAEIDYTDLRHPLFMDLFESTEQDKKPESPEIYQLQSNSGGTVLISSSESAVLSESVSGDGKILYYALSPDNEMSDIPLTGIFPALIFKSVMYLTAKEIKGNQFVTGNNADIMIEPKYAGDGNFEVTDPKGNSFFAEGANLPSGTLLSFNNLTIPGNYLIKNNEEVVSIFSVNNDPSESKTEYPDDKELRRKLNSIFSDDIEINIISSASKIDEMIIRARIGTELWQIFIILSLLLAVAEMIIRKTTKSEITEE